MSEQLYIYRWGNDKTPLGRFRKQWKGRECRVLVRGERNSCCIKFIDTGELLNISRNALGKVKNGK